MTAPRRGVLGVKLLQKRLVAVFQKRKMAYSFVVLAISLLLIPLALLAFFSDRIESSIEIHTPNTAGQEDFNCGQVEQYVAPHTGEYQLEVWGAQGGGGGWNSYQPTLASGGKGGYSSGVVTLTQGTTVYILAGCQGQTPPPTPQLTTGVSSAGGWNGGGSATQYGNGGGGGGSDIRIGTNSLYARVIVAGGGGGGGNSQSASVTSDGGAGGGANGQTMPTSTQYGSRVPGQGGTQTAPGNNTTSPATTAPAFGQGAGGSGQNLRGGGGGGWYGGSMGANSTGGGGGSGYIWTAATAGNYPAGGLLTASYYLTSAQTVDGTGAMPNPSGGTMTGRSGDGFARITPMQTPPTITLIDDDPYYVAIGTTYIDPGATASDTVDGDLTSSIVVTGSVNPYVVGSYIVTYTVTNSANLTASTTRTVIVIPSGDSFSCTQSVQSFSAPQTGKYQLETWGAQGGNGNGANSIGGKGAYAAGTINLTIGQTIYVSVGCAGANHATYAGGGGGGTDIATTNNITYADRIIVAGGGGGGGRTSGAITTTNGRPGAAAGAAQNGFAVSSGGAQGGDGGSGNGGGGGGNTSASVGGAGYGGALGGGSGTTYLPGSPGGLAVNRSGGLVGTSGGGVGGWNGGGGGAGSNSNGVANSGFGAGGGGDGGINAGGGGGGGGNGGGGGGSSGAGAGGGGGYGGGGGGSGGWTPGGGGGGGGSYTAGTLGAGVTTSGANSMPTQTGTSTMTGNSGNGFAKITLLTDPVIHDPPTIALVGEDPITIPQGGIFNDPGATATDPVFGDLTSSIVVTSNINTSVVGTYTVTYSITNAYNLTATVTRTVIVVTAPVTTDFSCTNAVRPWTVPTTGTYKLETWGAQGGHTTYGGKGGYSVGETNLTAGDTLYIAVGCAGSITTGTNIPGGFNGGGMQQYANNGTFGSGGGATHISKSTGLLTETSVRNDILIVAGGGGGAGYSNAYGGVGGGTTGGNGVSNGYTTYATGQGGTQSAGGTISGTYTNSYGTATVGTAGQGGTGVGYSGGGGGGGGGWFGGSGGMINSGGGGSSYIVGLSNSQTIAGSAAMPATGGGTETGHAGNGFARITYTPPAAEEFDYTGAVQTYTVPTTSNYRLEVWGAAGGYNGNGGAGGYSVGQVSLTAGQTLYIYAGQAGGMGQTTGAFGGGGQIGGYSSVGQGGGASDIRIDTDSLYARVIVAGGGGGSYSTTILGGAGGGTSGIAGGTGTNGGGGGTQTAGGTGRGAGTWGRGAGATGYSDGSGGGGWYGGGMGYNTASQSGGGGSGWVYTAATYSTWASAVGSSTSNQWLLTSANYLTNENTIAGNATMPNPTGGTMTGNTGNGYVRITRI